MSHKSVEDWSLKIYTVSPLFEIQAFLTSYSSRIIYFEQFQDDEDNDDDRCVETLNSIFNFSAVFFFTWKAFDSDYSCIRRSEIRVLWSKSEPYGILTLSFVLQKIPFFQWNLNVHDENMTRENFSSRWILYFINSTLSLYLYLSLFHSLFFSLKHYNRSNYISPDARQVLTDCVKIGYKLILKMKFRLFWDDIYLSSNWPFLWFS